MLKLEEFQDVYCIEAGQRPLLQRGASLMTRGGRLWPLEGSNASSLPTLCSMRNVIEEGKNVLLDLDVVGEKLGPSWVDRYYVWSQ